MKRHHLLLLFAPACLVGACGGIMDGGDTRVLGTVEFYNDPVAIAVPEEVAAGVEFSVSVRTYGGGCERMGPTETLKRGDTIFVEPYDFTKAGVATICTRELKLFDHSATLMSPSAGDLTVVIRGMAEPAGSMRTYPHDVVVR